MRKGGKWHTGKNFKPSREFNADNVFDTFMQQKNETHPYNKVSGDSYEYFIGMDMHKIIGKIEKVDDHTVRFMLTRPEALFLANMAIDSASILSAEYTEPMLRKAN